MKLLSPASWLLLASLAAGARAELHVLTLHQAADLALKQAPEALLSRLDQQKAAERVRIARDPFVPKVFAGSGLAYSNGFPMSIEGAAPSVIQSRAVASVYNRQQKFQVAQAREDYRGATLDAQGKREQTLFQALSLYLDAELRGRQSETASHQLASAEKLEELVRLRVAEGRELPLEAKRAALELARIRLRAEGLEGDRAFAEGSLAMVLGFPAGDRVRPAAEERQPPELPSSAQAAISLALQDNREIRRLESALLARNLEVKSHQASRYPRLDLVAQYGLFARFNNYEDFFRKFQRNNGQLGVSIQVPLLFGPAASAAAAIADAEAARLRIEVNQTRSRITLDTEQRFHEVRKAEAARQVARLDLEVARETLSVLLALLEEGRASLQQVELARLAESEKWLAYYEAQHSVDKARYALLERTGSLLASLP